MILLGAFIFYAGLASAFLLRLFPHWNTAVPGGLEDTRLFLWNAWWFRYALKTLHVSPFSTSYLFHPFGTSLISHDFPLWTNLVTYIAQNFGFSIIGASNIWFLTTWALTGFCTFLLAREVCGKDAPALVAGVFVMTHSYALARAMQNWGQFNIYGIPLFLWLLVRARRSEGRLNWIIAGVALAWTAACHYYFLLYCVSIWLVVAFLDISGWKFQITRTSSTLGTVPKRRYSTFVGLGLAIAGAVLSTWILLQHPHAVTIGQTTIGLESPANALLLFWVGVITWVLSFWKINMSRLAAWSRSSLVGHFCLIVSASLVLSPLLWKAALLALGGDYPKQSILWKTHPVGANLFSLLMPNPLQAFWGSSISAWYTSSGLNPQEEAASLGWVFLLVVVSSALWRGTRQERRWLALAAGSTILAMGVYLHIADFNTWLPLPFFFWRLFPVIGNVRIPERWMAVGSVAGGVVFALALCRLARDRKWKLSTICGIALALVLFENWPGLPFVSVPAPQPAYEALRNLPPGGVLALPLFIGDSSIGAGDSLPADGWYFPWDQLLAQTTHEHPIVGGYVGRISKRIVRAYEENPFTADILALEEHRPLPYADPDAIYLGVQQLEISYILVFPQATDPSVMQFIRRNLQLQSVSMSPLVELYQAPAS